jgi:hypothetical protein
LKDRTGRDGPWGGAWAECDGVVGAAGAGEGGRRIVKRVAVGQRARALEHLRVGRRPAHHRGRERAATAVFRPRERIARAAARHAAAGAELRGAHRVQVRRARRRTASAFGRRIHQHRQVVTSPPLPSSVNSASVAGGAAPEPQSPVAQTSQPVETEHPVRAHMRPDQPDGVGTARDPPGGNSNPVGSSRGLPALDRMPGQAMSVHRFTNVMVAASPSAKTRTNIPRHYTRSRSDRIRNRFASTTTSAQDQEDERENGDGSWRTH